MTKLRTVVLRRFAIGALALALVAAPAIWTYHAYAMSIHEAAEIIYKEGKRDIGKVRRYSKPLARAVEHGFHSVYHWCAESVSHTATCVSIALDLAA
ncbi:hypothetical protein MYX64_10670 [Nitrospinae bacterium AH_259_B05_G02_I21]|nr:hypothetical protein [Nitrospinae bacterium AH_259_B05_G02_I21]